MVFSVIIVLLFKIVRRAIVRYYGKWEYVNSQTKLFWLKEGGNMRKRTRIRLLALLSCFLFFFSMSYIRSKADDTYSVNGTVDSDTTSSYLYLNTAQGKMTIAIDSDMDLSGCKMLLPDKKVVVECHRGSDAYLHASKIYEQSAVVDSSNSTTVYGTVTSKTTEDIIYLSTTSGTMQIKVDATTDMTNCHVITVGQVLYITTARGSDAYMHAISIRDNNSSQLSSDTITIDGITMPYLTGTVASNTTSSLLYFSTSGGTMIIKYDSNTDYTGCLTLIPGQAITVACYRGNDAYMHAAKIVNNGDAGYASAGTYSTTADFTGKVSSSSTLNTLYLVTDGGTMQIKLDTSTSLSTLPLIIGEKVTVTCGHGSDALWHAINIKY